MTDQEKQKKIAEWKLLNGFAESKSLNSMTRTEIMKIIEPQKEKMRLKLSQEYKEIFGEDYKGDIIKDIVMDLDTRAHLEKLCTL